MTPRFALFACALPKYRDHHRKLLSCPDQDLGAQLFWESGAMTTTLYAKLDLQNRRQKSWSVQLLPENGRYRLSMNSDRSRHRPIGETERMSVVQGAPRAAPSAGCWKVLPPEPADDPGEHGC